MAGFFHSAPPNLKLVGRRLGGLLHELMQEDGPPVHDRAAKDPRDALGCLEATLGQSATHRSGMTHARVWAERLHPLRASQESGDHTGRQREGVAFDALAGEGDGPGHNGSIAYSLCLSLAPASQPGQAKLADRPAALLGRW
jgi:hypothetical protein